MGTLLIWAVYALTHAVAPKSHFAPLIAAGFASIDGLAIAQSRLAMNDIFVTFWVTLALLFYLRYLGASSRRAATAGTSAAFSRYLWLLAGATGCAIASKWSGALLFGFFGLWEFIHRLFRPQFIRFCRSFYLLLFLALTSCLIYLLSYSGLFAHHNFSHFLELHHQIFAYQLHLDASHDYASPAWTWPFAWHPVYLHLDADTGQQWWNEPFYPSWYLSLWCLLFALAVVAAHFLTGSFTVTDHRWSFLLLAYFCLWLPWVFSPRIMFFHHYLPALPCVWAIAGLVIDRYILAPFHRR
jgi:dolichyl-phosphate-mannose--protein O-mannosyl transferase